MLGKWTKFCLGRFGEALRRKWHLCEGNGVKAIEVSHGRENYSKSKEKYEKASMGDSGEAWHKWSWKCG